MSRNWLCLLTVSSLLLLGLFAISYATQQSDSDEAPVLAPNRALVPVPIFTDEITWAIGTNMPTARYSSVTGTYGDEIFVAVGRQSDSSPYNTAVCEAYDYGADTWRTNCASAPAALRMSAFGVMYQGDYLYVVGGRDNSNLTVGSLYIYNMATNSWTTGPSASARWAHGGAVLDGYVYIFGGDGVTTPNTSVQRYNIASNTWETLANLPTGDGWVCGAAAAGKVYCIGGSTNSTRMLEYSPGSNTWTTRAPIPHARTYSTAVAYDNLIYVIGGNAPSANLVDVYNPATNTWTAETNTPGNICWEALGVSESAIYVIGGTPSSAAPIQYQNEVWIGPMQAPEYGNIEGVVLEAAGANDPIEDAAVVLHGDTTWTNALGEYSFIDVPVGTYDITASAFGYNSETHSVDIIAGQTITQDFALTQPIITVDVTNLSPSLAAGEIYSETFNISNLGDGELTFDIEVNLEGGGGIQTILVVDDDGGQAGFMNVEQYFYDALDDAGYSYDTFDASAAGPTYAQMADYDLVIWFTGENWQVGSTLTAADESNLSQYLDAGGHLFLSAQDYFYDKYPGVGAFSAGQFPYDYLGVMSTSQDFWSLPFSTNGVSGSFAEGMAFQCQDPYSINTLYPDMLVTSGTQLLTISGGATACQFEGSSFKVAFTTLSFGALVDGAAPSTKAQFMENMIAWMSSRDAGIVNALPRPSVAPPKTAEIVPGTQKAADRIVPKYCGPLAPPVSNPFETDEPWLTVDPSTGTVQPQQSEMITATFEMPDTAEIGETYEGQILIHNNSVQTPITIPITVQIVSAVGDKSDVSPSDYVLYQNYPNPFNPSTDIRFDLRQTSHVHLAVYNILGQEVATLADRSFEAGSHALTFNASSLASGIYFYRIDAGQFTDMRKMILLK
jgi:N-acetylneuraminic acid mutarotase